MMVIVTISKKYFGDRFTYINLPEDGLMTAKL